MNTPNHINLHAVTDHNRSVDALACFALFCVAVAGKASKVQALASGRVRRSAPRTPAWSTGTPSP